MNWHFASHKVLYNTIFLLCEWAQSSNTTKKKKETDEKHPQMSKITGKFLLLTVKRLFIVLLKAFLASDQNNNSDFWPVTTAWKRLHNCIMRNREKARTRQLSFRTINVSCKVLVCLLWSIIKIQTPLIHRRLICKWIELPGRGIPTKSARHGVIIAFPCTCPVKST